MQNNPYMFNTLIIALKAVGFYVFILFDKISQNAF